MTAAFDTLWSSTAVAAFAEVMGDTVSIRRGASTTTGVTAQKLQGERYVNLDEGGRVQFAECAWIIAKEDYQIASAEVDPKPGDRIIESDGSEWQITPIDEVSELNELPGGDEWLVNTKRVQGPT